ncbi:hypothetical protein HN51_046945 [Arachis hypogaea]
MGFLSYNPSRRFILMILVIIFIMMVASSSQFGAECRPLLQDGGSRREFNGILLQMLPRGPSRRSGPDPIHP